MLTDRHGNAVSTASRPALDALDRAGEMLLGYRADPLAEIDAALADQPDFAMGHAFRAGLMALAMERGAAAEALRSVEAGNAVPAATERERAHLAAARAAAEGEFARAHRLYGEIAAAHPRDLFALQVAHQLDFFLGDAGGLRDRPRAAMRAWREGEAGSGWILGMQAFGLEECGQYAAAEDAGRMALALEPTDGWAVHAVAHVMEMGGRAGEGVVFLSRREADWSVGALLAVHNWWHMALFHLEHGGFDQALAIYDRSVAPGPASPSIELVDASAMLWRMMLRGMEVRGRFAAVSDAWERLGGEGWYAFSDLHAVMAHLGAGRDEQAEAVLAAMRWAADGIGTNARLTRDVGLPLAEGFRDLVRGRPAEAVERIAPVRRGAIAFGGSNAQRDVISLTLLEAALRADDRSLARALAGERIEAKPKSPFAREMMERARRVPVAA
jgi:tetratricopeptide (TPR) repeat protein